MAETPISKVLEEASYKARADDILGAVELYRNATELDGSSASAWYGLAVMQSKRGNTADAVSAFERAHDLKPDHAPTSANLAVLLESRNPVRAASLAKLALKTLSDVEELTRIAERHPPEEPLILPARIVEKQVQEVIPHPPMLDSKPVDEEPLMLEATPVLADIADVFAHENARDHQSSLKTLILP